MEIKQFDFFLVLLKYRKIITVKTVTLYKKLYEEAGTNFVLLCQSRTMVGQLKKVYLHRPIKILYFLTRARIQKCSI